MGFPIPRFLRQSKRRHCIAIDIGSNTAIRTLRFEEVEGKAVISKKAHFELPFRKNERDLIPLMSEHLRRLLFGYLKEIGHIPDGILVGLGNHFTFNEMTVRREERERPESVISASEFQAILSSFLTEHKTRTVDGKTYVLAHVMPFRITVDGYAVEHLTHETRGRVIEMTLFATYADEEFYTRLHELKRILGGLELRFISDQAAVASAMVALMRIEHALIVKIGAAVTEISLLAEGAIRFSGRFESGGDAFTEAIAKRLTIKRDEAERIKRQLHVAKLPANTASALNIAIQTTAALWVNGLAALLKSEERFLIPEQVFLLGGGARLREIQDALNSLPWFNELTFFDRLDVRPLVAEDLTSPIFHNTISPLTGPEEVALASLAYRLSSSFLTTFIPKQP